MSRKKLILVTKKCLCCDNDMTLPEWYAKKRKFCSNTCSSKYNRDNKIITTHFKKGCIPHNKGISLIDSYGEDKANDLKNSNSIRHKGNTAWNKGHTTPLETINKMVTSRKAKSGWNRTELQNMKCSASIQGVTLDEWKGFTSNERTKEYNSKEWKIVLNSVLKRDNYCCKECGDHNYKGRGCNVRLEVHHIKEWINYPELRLDETNLITLCVACHNKTKLGGRTNKNYNKETTLCH